MRERKHVKLRVDMYDDTKFKIIDKMDDRDVIHYIWTRVLTLAGKVNLEGNLYMSKNIPYTVETLAIEFNRSCEKVRLALKVLKDLEMIECNEEGVYKVRNFAKHQNIKVKEQSKDIAVNEEIKNEVDIIKDIDNRDEIDYTKNKSNKTSNIIDFDKNIVINESDNKEKLESDLNSNMQIPLKKKKTQKRKQSSNKRNSKNDIVEIDEADNEIIEFFTGEDIPKRKGDTVISSFEW